MCLNCLQDVIRNSAELDSAGPASQTASGGIEDECFPSVGKSPARHSFALPAFAS